MKNRTQLAADLQYYQNTCQEYERTLKEQETLSKEWLARINDPESMDNAEFQEKLSQNINTIEEINQAFQEAKYKINEIQFLLKSRKDHILDFLKHINDGKEGVPASWCEQIQLHHQGAHAFHYDLPTVIDNKLIKEFTHRAIDHHSLLALSEIMARLTLRKNGFDDSAIEINNSGNYVIENSNGSMTVVDLLAVGRPHVIIMTEYCINYHDHRPVIQLVADKAILCQKKNLFSVEDIDIEENYTTHSKDIHETLVNHLMLRVMRNFLDCMNESPETAAGDFIRQT